MPTTVLRAPPPDFQTLRRPCDVVLCHSQPHSVLSFRQDLTFLNRLQIISSMIRNTFPIKFVAILLQKIHMKTNLSMLKLR